MKTHIIGYDLNRPEQNYDHLIEAIKSYGTWWHHLDSTWLIRTPQTAVAVRDNLRRYIDQNDELLVATLTGETAWTGFSEPGSTWLTDNL